MKQGEIWRFIKRIGTSQAVVLQDVLHNVSLYLDWEGFA